MLLSKCTNECVPRYDDLKKKYTDQCTERRRLNNELIELKGNIRVFCRCRPLSADEVTRRCSSVVEIDSLCETELQFLPSEKERKAFKFDHVFGPEDSQGMFWSTVQKLYLVFIVCYIVAQVLLLFCIKCT
jgi:kinesin family member C2/C3